MTGNASFSGAWAPYIVLLVFAVLGLATAVKGWRQGAWLRSYTPVTVAEVEPGLSCVVVGKAAAASGGVYAAPWSGESCVWHHDQIVEAWSTGKRGSYVRNEERYSSAPVDEIGVSDDSGSLTVRQVGIIDDAYVAFRRDRRRGLRDFGEPDIAVDLPDGRVVAAHDERIGARERILRPGEPVLVLGRAVRRGADRVIDAELVSTGTLAALTRKARHKSLKGLAAGFFFLTILAGLYTAGLYPQ